MKLMLVDPQFAPIPQRQPHSLAISRTPTECSYSLSIPAAQHESFLMSAHSFSPILKSRHVPVMHRAMPHDHQQLAGHVAKHNAVPSTGCQDKNWPLRTRAVLQWISMLLGFDLLESPSLQFYVEISSLIYLDTLFQRSTLYIFF